MSVSENSTVREPIEMMEDGDQQFGLGELAVSSFGKSPYTDQKFVALDVGSARTRFLVHRTLLEQSPVLSGKASSFLGGDKSIADVIPLPDLDEPTAHTLVHYLYTGIFQTLRSPDLLKDGMLEGYKLGTCVYCAATRYKIPGLANLAKDKITFCGDSLSILDILIVSRESAFPMLLDDEVWFPTYLETAIKDAFNKDPELFSKPDFSDQIEGDRRYRQVVMKAILNAVARGPVATNEAQSGVPKPAEEEMVEISSARVRHDSGTQGLPEELNGTAEPDINGAAKPEEDTPLGADAADENPTTVETSKTVEPVFDAIDPVVEETPAKPEPVTDETGWGKSTTYQNMGGKKSKKDVVSEDAPIVQEATVQDPAPLIQESIVEQESLVVKEIEPIVGKESPVVKESEPVVEEVNAVSKELVGESTPTGEDASVQNETPVPKKNRKNRKKKAAQAGNAAVAVA
ncbi:hypothetical protein BCR34DRAFT_587118 [Clohesyomyces aquaticus]|uniref:BTB domain-containing protein n=1 Tax=Clohesyomyces aquaticus TaxID=1231657 RepID=A0A1Y1ZR08_9PLEO|nr:hypothetical protein BCR34DRAFT_587118 [Clohesyomyces aquaticus]